MTHRKSPLMKRTLLAVAMLALAACNTPARIEPPDDRTVEDGKRALDQLAQLPPAVERIRIGDQLRIVRDAGEMPTLSAFNVSTIYELTRKLAPTYREPRVTVNINQAPANSVIVGGAVNNPTAVQIATANTLEQAIVGAGGINPAGDASMVALLREDAQGAYRAYFLDFSQLLKTGPDGRKPVRLQRGDVVFVPKSNVGERIQGVDTYLNQLIPFTKSIGVGYNYTRTSGGSN